MIFYFALLGETKELPDGMTTDNEVKPANRLFDRIATKVTRATGSPLAFIIALTLIILWAITGPIFNYSDTWQLVINTSTTIITFLMVFIIQQSANKDTTALQLKLNELIAANKYASNQLVDIEDLTDEELQTVKKFYIRLADKAEAEGDLTKTHSFSEADAKAERKAIERNSAIRNGDKEKEEVKKVTDKKPKPRNKTNGTGKAVS